jgi:hypothetical protein
MFAEEGWQCSTADARSTPRSALENVVVRRPYKATARKKANMDPWQFLCGRPLHATNIGAFASAPCGRVFDTPWRAVLAYNQASA